MLYKIINVYTLNENKFKNPTVLIFSINSGGFQIRKDKVHNKIRIY